MILKHRQRLLLAIFGLGLSALVVVYVVNNRAMSAQEYYLAILPDPTFATHTPTDSERERISRRLGSSGVSAEELERLARETTPAKQLAPLLNDVLRNLPAKYERVSDVFAGVYPSGGFNARTLKSPDGGYLILVNYDLKKSLWEWAKLVINALALQKGTGLQPDGTIDEIITAYVESTREYAQLGIVPKFPQYTADEKGVLVALLHTATMKFILAHEYAHILLGHVDQAPTEVAQLLHSSGEQGHDDGYFTRELDADKLAVEMFIGRSSVTDYLELPPEIQILGIYFSLAIFETLDNIRGSDEQGVTYPGLDSRKEAIRTLLKHKTIVVEHPVVADVMNALDYLVLHTHGEPSGQSALWTEDLKALVMKEDSTSAESSRAHPSSADTRDLLDTRSGRATTQDAEFVRFMREFSRRQAADDWDGMQTLASKTRRWEEHVEALLVHATACSVKGLKSIDLPWNPDQELDASGFIELAVTILAARQGKKNIQEAVLDEPVRSRVLLVWRLLYGTSLGVIGTSNDRAPTQYAIVEARDKNVASLRIAQLLQDPVLMRFSVLAGAWAFERIGDVSRASSLRSELGDRFEWPPIAKNGNGDYIIQYPLFDYSGNKIPTSFEEVLEK